MEDHHLSPSRLHVVRLDRREGKVAALPAGVPFSTAALRILLGLAWTANAALKWVPAFGTGLLSSLSDASQGTLLFLTLLAADAGVGVSRLSVDNVLERRMPGWRRLAELDWAHPQIEPSADR
jgi:hypothetical protein